MTISFNSYFDSGVQSLASTTSNGDKYSVGIIAVGHYHFDTESPERMSVINGELTIKLDGSSEWVSYSNGSYFEVPANSGFSVKATNDTAYHCQYL
mmetsp:Transcript_5261/g.6763  ORF Transcript_5261/g.6763 Transcript_5261/m.6763 type:complete len:96 (-) Transcript_5261:242-529(-)